MLNVKLRLMQKPSSKKQLKMLSAKLRPMRKLNSKKRLKMLNAKLRPMRKLNSKKQQKTLNVKLRLMQKPNNKKQQKMLDVKLRLMQKPNNKKQQKMLDVKPKLRPKKKLHLLKKLKKKLPRKKVKLKKLHLRLNVILSRKFVVLGMFLQVAVVKLLALDLPCLTQVVLARLLLHGQVEMMHWMQVSKLQFRHLLPTQCHRILMQDEKREALPLLSEHNNFVRVTCFK
ncbi:tolA [Acinetobacter baumannii]|nr:tolA [Acinetobacter baumannii]